MPAEVEEGGPVSSRRRDPSSPSSPSRPRQEAPPVTDYASQAWNVLAPGQAGGLAPTRNSTDQANLYDGLTPLRGAVSDRDLRRFFKRETLGLGSERAVSTERPRPGLLVQRDRWGVPHVNGERDVDVAFGAGWVTAQDRQPVLELLRGPGRLAALDVPGVDPLAAVLPAGRSSRAPRRRRSSPGSSGCSSVGAPADAGRSA